MARQHGPQQAPQNEGSLPKELLSRVISHEQVDRSSQPRNVAEPTTPYESRFQTDFAATPVRRAITFKEMQTPIAGPMGGPDRLIVQRKITVGSVGDKYEQEADRVAAQVVKEINTPAAQPPHIQREEVLDKNDKLRMKPLMQRRVSPQTLGGGDASADLESAINQARGSGQALDPGLQAQIGQAMRADFSRVRVHTDAQSDQLNQSIQARAFTTGQDMFFRQGAYAPGSPGGKELIAHELVHVVQQNGKAVRRLSEKREQSQRNSTSDYALAPKVKEEIHEKGKKTANRTVSSIEQYSDTIGFPQMTATAIQMHCMELNETVPRNLQTLGTEVIQRVKQNPRGNFNLYENAAVQNSGITAGVHPNDAEVSAEGDFTAQSAPTNPYGWATMQDSFNYIFGGGIGGSTRLDLSIRAEANGTNLSRMHLIYHRLAQDANNNIDNMVLGPRGLNTQHYSRAEGFLGASMSQNFYFITRNSLSTMLVPGEIVGKAPAGHPNVGIPYVVNPNFFPNTLLDPNIGILAVANGVPPNAWAISTDENVLDDHLVLWYQVIPTFGLNAAGVLNNINNAIQNVYNNHRVNPGKTFEFLVSPSPNGNTLVTMRDALVGIYATALTIKGSFFTLNPKEIPPGGTTADQIPWYDSRLPRRPLTNNNRPYARLRMIYDDGSGVMANTGYQIYQL